MSTFRSYDARKNVQDSIIVAITMKHSKGRPRTFDADAALQSAMRVFWEKGYEAASLSDLTEAMRINPPSLYAAFGNKRELFRRVLERYAEGPAAYVMESLRQPTARAVAEHRLNGAVKAMTATGRPKGCLAVQAAARLGNSCDAMRQELITYCAGSHQALCKRFARAKAEGDLPKNCDTAALARYVTTVAQGISLQAAAGASAAELRKVVKTALLAWPESRALVH